MRFSNKNLIVVGVVFNTLMSFSQTVTDLEVLRAVLYDISKGSYIYLQCEKPKTYFDVFTLDKRTLENIPSDLPKEFNESAKNSQSGYWNSAIVNDLKIHPNILYPNGCQSIKAVHKLHNKTKKKLDIVSIALSEPIYDQNYEHAFLEVQYWKNTAFAFVLKYFLKLIYGKWVIINFFEQ